MLQCVRKGVKILKFVGGIDIGGTKCAVSLGVFKNNNLSLIDKVKIKTSANHKYIINELIRLLKSLIDKHNVELESIGICSGGPLNAEKGILISPAMLPGWENINVISPFVDAFNVSVYLQNDANACVLSEWRWGLNRKVNNMAYLTFGTGLGAGLILNGQLYSGTNDLAGEIGHITVDKSNDALCGYNKKGSLEAYCGGGNIPSFAYRILSKRSLDKTITKRYESLTTKEIGELAQNNDSIARFVLEEVAKKLAIGIGILIDILNLELVVLGNIYLRQKNIIEPILLQHLQKEALPESLDVCKIETSLLGEEIGDYASLTVALNNKY